MRTLVGVCHACKIVVCCGVVVGDGASDLTMK